MDNTVAILNASVSKSSKVMPPLKGPAQSWKIRSMYE